MRICHITSMHEWDDDRIFQRACLGLARQGHEVFLVATTPLPANPVKKDYPVTFSWIKRRRGIKRRIFSSREAVTQAIGLKAEIYHFHDPDILPFAGRIKKALPKARIIYDIHENYAGRFQKWDSTRAFSGLLGNLFRNFEIRTINNIDGYTVVSDSMMQLFSKAQKPAIVIRNSTDLQRLKNIQLDGLAADTPVFIYTSGTNSHERDCLQTVKSLSYIQKKYPDVKMMFVGRYVGDIRNEMLEQAQSDGTMDNLMLEGMLPWEENFKRTSKAFCGCVFYADNPNNRVGIPNRIFEYMYTGIPVIATDFPELRKIVTEADCGVLVDSNNPESIADGIMSLLADREKALQMGKNGRRAMEEKFGYHIDLENKISFYQRLLNADQK